MIRLLARSHRLSLVIWPLALWATCELTASSIVEFYTAPSARAGYAAAIDTTPVITAISGSGTGLDSLGGIVANELAIILFTGLALAGILMSTSLTRGEEDRGRTELVTAKPVHRTTPLLAAMVLVVGMVVLLAAALLTSMALHGIPLVGGEEGTAAAATSGVVTYCLSVMAYGLVFAGVGFVAAELVVDVSGARILASAVFFVCYLVRIIVVATGSSAWWASPLGWFDHVEPFADTRLWPLGLLTATAVALFVAAFMIRRLRDLDSGVVRSCPGRAHGSALLGTPLGLWARLCRSTALIWVTLGLAMGVLLGYLLPDWVEVMELNLESLEAFGFTASADSISQMMGLIAALFGGAAGISVVSTIAGEESSERASVLLARPLSRQRWWAAGIAVACMMVIVVTGVTVGGYVASAAVSGADLDAGRTVILMSSYLVPGLLFATLAAAGHGLRLGGHRVAWLVYAATAVLAFLGEIMNTPQWVLDLSPLNALGLVPIDDPDMLAVGVQLGVIVVAVVVARWAFRRREIR